MGYINATDVILNPGDNLFRFQGLIMPADKVQSLKSLLYVRLWQLNRAFSHSTFLHSLGPLCCRGIFFKVFER